jgi:N-acetylmuramoyl-L-alanine amidase
MRQINSIILHCTATKEGIDYSVDTIRKWHVSRGFVDIGYHYIIHLDGTIEAGRPIERIGAHCTGKNQNSIGIVYIGGLDSKGNTKDTRTIQQKQSLNTLVKSLMQEYDISIDDVYGHYEWSNKACPCFDVDEFRNAIRNTYTKHE